MDCPLGFAPEVALEDLGLPLWGPGVEIMQLLGSQEFWQHQVLRGVGGYGSRKYSALKGYGNKYWPICSIFLPGDPNLPDREAWQTTVYRVGKRQTWLKWPCAHRHKTFFFFFFACGSSVPVRVEHGSGAAAWLAGTPVVPSVQEHRLPPPQELWPYHTLFLSFL